MDVTLLALCEEIKFEKMYEQHTLNNEWTHFEEVEAHAVLNSESKGYYFFFLHFVGNFFLL